MVKLKKINLEKRCGNDNCDHPDIKKNKFYLAKLMGSEKSYWVAGQFSKEWYGWNFASVYDAGLQLNDDSWLELYEIQERGRKIIK